jgi:hypothetical protein
VTDDDWSASIVLRAAETGGSFDFWNDPAENVYLPTGGEPVE